MIKLYLVNCSLCSLLWPFSMQQVKLTPLVGNNMIFTPITGRQTSSGWRCCQECLPNSEHAHTHIMTRYNRYPVFGEANRYYVLAEIRVMLIIGLNKDPAMAETLSPATYFASSSRKQLWQKVEGRLVASSVRQHVYALHSLYLSLTRRRTQGPLWFLIISSSPPLWSWHTKFVLVIILPSSYKHHQADYLPENIPMATRHFPQLCFIFSVTYNTF